MGAMASKPAALEAQALSRRHPTHLGLRHRTALASVDLTVPTGSVLGLVGPNGSGKSTFLRLAAGVDRPSGGSLRVLGGSPREPRIRRRIGYLPEDNPFPADLSARAAFDLLGALDGLPRRRIREEGTRLLEEVGLGDVGRLALGRYSRGMGRRFGLAQAWLGDPELLLLDEATAGLDAEGFAVLERLLDRARARGATVVLASHLISDILDHCDRVAVLVNGRMVASGPTAEVLRTEGRLRLDIDGLAPEDLESLEAWLEERGGRLHGHGPAGRPLVELFRDAPSAPTEEGAPD
jgi:ABC-2 type transport system ATP-binding protein